MKTFKTLLLALASATLLAACGGGSDDDVHDPQLRFVHAAPGVPAVTLARNGADDGNATNVGYRYAARYRDVNDGATTLVLRTATAGLQIGSPVSFHAHHGDKYTLLVVRDGIGADWVFIDDPSNVSVTTDDARLRVVNGSSNAPNVDIYVTAPGADIANVGPSLAAVPYKQARPASGSDSLELEGGRYQVRATPAGSKTVIFNATIAVPQEADWVLVTVPTSAVGTLLPNAIRMLLVRADDPSNAALEIDTAP